ncbi:uncharacterized protein LOC108460476 isoform X3 [Gossypium arboreum]|uniref:uncharacterized protein LOC108460476 isoform X3 n=1 Tax=Gossypium arboreum TaxID=29729 RepID=UPI0008194F0B|nr:uncharacterized protein LOC108460476 isoform X3 [Gossypium arboreum]
MCDDAQICFAEVVAGSAAWLGRGLSCVCAQRRESDARPSFDLTPSEEECLQRLQNRIDIAYDSSIPEHQEALRALWNAVFPEEELHGLISEQWKEMGWQGKDPSTDFRGGGFISLENLLFFARHFPKSFKDLLWKQEGDRSAWEYPFAVAGVNITFMLIQMLDLEAVKPRTMVGAIFLKFLSANGSSMACYACILHGLQYCDESHALPTGKGVFTGRYNTSGGTALVQSSYTIVESFSQDHWNGWDRIWLCLACRVTKLSGRKSRHSPRAIRN